VYAIFRVHNLPAHARVGARWIFPDGRRIVYVCPASDCPPRRFVSAHYTYWVEQTLAGPGQYAVSALVNGRAVGLHHFSVEAGASVPDQGDHDDHDRDTPDTTLATGLGVFAPHRRQATGDSRQNERVRRWLSSVAAGGLSHPTDQVRPTALDPA
jgi:hypothetical protein